MTNLLIVDRVALKPESRKKSFGEIAERVQNGDRSDFNLPYACAFSSDLVLFLDIQSSEWTESEWTEIKALVLKSRRLEHGQVFVLPREICTQLESGMYFGLHEVLAPSRAKTLAIQIPRIQKFVMNMDADRYERPTFFKRLKYAFTFN
jgi:hypothetical protein